MFIKHALQTKRIEGHTYEILPPHASLAQLNADICMQNLPSCPFCTAVYCLLDISTLELTYACAGHPEPILLGADGRIEGLPGPGPLLGIFPEAGYHSRRKQLARGDRVVLYTDGAEDAFRKHPGRDLRQLIADSAGMSRDQMLLRLAEEIDVVSQSTGPDDVTIVVLDIDR